MRKKLCYTGSYEQSIQSLCSVSDITEQQRNRDDSLLGGKQSVTFRSLPNKSLGFGLKNILCKKVLKLYACWLKTSHNISSVSHTLLTKEGTRNYLIKEFAGKKRERRLPGCHLRLGKNWWRGERALLDRATALVSR